MKIYTTHKQSFHTVAQEGFVATLEACDYKDPPTVTVIGGGTDVTDNEPVYMSDRKGRNGITEDGTATTLTAQEKERPIVGQSIVRRLTPLECERLQGFPDNWTLIGEPDGFETWTDDEGNEYPVQVKTYTDRHGKRKKLSDSARYRALGNSVALTFWEWLARRITAQYERPVTMGSLFDGIGGFPLVFQRVGATPVWASEIDEFCIEVTRRRFPDENEQQEGTE